MADLKSINSVAAASLKSFNGVAAASLKSIAGLTYPASGYDLSLMSYSGKNKDFSSYGNINSLAFSSDGSKMYVVNGNTTVNQFVLTTPWDVSTASYEKSKDITADCTRGHEVAFSSDGSKMYISSASLRTIVQYTLSTPWDVSTASYEKSKDIEVDGSTGVFYGLHFSSDGTKLYTNISTYVYQITLSAPWDISTARYASKKYTTISYSPIGIALSENGKKLFFTDYSAHLVRQFSLSPAWDVSTASADGVNLDVSNEVEGFIGVRFSSGGTNLYIHRRGYTTVYQYSM